LFIEAIIAGIILGRLRSGSISALENIKFKGWKILIILLLMDMGLRLYIINSSSNLGEILFNYYPVFSIIFYLITIIILDLNKNLKHLRIIQSGYVLNLLPMLINGGKMPVLESALDSIDKLNEIDLLKSNVLLTHKLVDETTRFKFLADNIPFPYFFPKVISIGDVILSIGLVLFISHYMTIGRKFPNNR
jgi:hypothetical protein